MHDIAYFYKEYLWRCNIVKKYKDLTSNNSDEQVDENISDANPASKIQIEQINKTGAVVVNNGRYTIYCLMIFGEIEGHGSADDSIKTTKYERIIPQLVAIEESPSIDGLLILINTVGGDIEAGLSLAELIAGMEKPTVSMVLGGGHSIGVPLAVSAKRTFIAKSASMTVHPVRTTGTTLGTSQAFEYLKRLQKRITNFVADNSKISADRFLKLVTNTSELDMDIGTVLEGKEAVKEGIIDKVGNLSIALECLYNMIEKENFDKTSRSKKLKKSKT